MIAARGRDAVQAVGKVPIDFHALGVTTLVDDAGILSQDEFIQSQQGCDVTDQTVACTPIGKVLLGAYAEVAYDVLPSDVISLAEVVKSPTAEMEEGGIAGNVGDTLSE